MQKTVNSREDAVFFELFDEDTARWRPGPFVDPRPQERVLQHTLEHADDVCPFVQILYALVPQTGEQLVHFFKFLDAQSPVGQVIDVPKISQDRTQQRLVDNLRQPQMAEQLVEVPTVLFSSSRLSNRSLTSQFRLVVGVFFDVIVKHPGREHGNSVQTPATHDVTEEELERLDLVLHSRYMSQVARCLFLSQDPTDLTFIVDELCQKIS